MKWRHPCRTTLRKIKKGKLSLIAEIAAVALKIQQRNIHVRETRVPINSGYKLQLIVFDHGNSSSSKLLVQGTRVPIKSR